MKKIIAKLVFIFLFNFGLISAETVPTKTNTTKQTTVDTKKDTNNSTDTSKEITEKILKYGDRVRLRFAKLQNKTLHTDNLKYIHKNSSGGQQVSGFLDPTAYKKYKENEANDEWIILPPNAMYDNFMKGKVIKSGSQIRIYNPKTNSKLQFQLSPQYKSPLPSLLEVTTIPNEQLSNSWIITIQKNASKNGELIYGKTLFSIEAQNGQKKKYLSVYSNKFRITNDIRDNRKQSVVGLDDKVKNYLFIEELNKAPQKPPVEKKVEKKVVEEKKETVEKTNKKKAKIIKVPEYSNLMWSVNSTGKALFRNENDWTEINDQAGIKIINHITVGPQNSLWIIDYKNNLYYKKESSKKDATTTSWVQIRDNNITDFIDISAGANGNIWAISKKNQVLFRNNITTNNLLGSEWTESKIMNLGPNERIIHLSVGPQGNVATISNKENIYLRKNSSWEKINFVGIKNIKQISLGPNGTCWATNKDNEIYFLKNINNNTDKWYKIEGILSQIVISPKGSVWGVHPSGLLYIRNGITNAMPTGQGWQNIADNISSIAFSPNNIPFCIFRSGFNFHQKENTTFSQFVGNKILSMRENKWVPTSTKGIISNIKISSINFTSYGTVFAMDIFGNIYQRYGINSSNLSGTSWTKIDSPMLRGLELIKDENGTILMATNINNKLLKLKTNITLQNPLGKIASADASLPTFEVKQFISKNGINFALDKQGTFYFQKNKLWTSDKTENLLQIAFDKRILEKETKLRLWGINSKENVLFKNNITEKNPKGSSWIIVSGIKMQEIFVRPNGEVWGLSFEEHSRYKGNYKVYIRQGISKENPQGSSWEYAKTYVSQLPNSPKKVIHYGDKVLIASSYDQNNTAIKRGSFIDCSRKIITLNSLNFKNSQQLQIVNPTNENDKSIIKNGNQFILKTNNNEYLTIKKTGDVFFLQTNLKRPIATTFSMNNNLGSSAIEYEQTIYIQAINKYLTHLYEKAIQSNLILSSQKTTPFLLLKPITVQEINQINIDQVKSTAFTLLEELDKNLQNIREAKNAFASIIEILNENKNKIDSDDLELILETIISTDKKSLLSEKYRNNVLQNILPNITKNKETEAILKRVTNKFKSEIKNISDPAIATFKFLELFYNNKSFLVPEEQQALKNLVSNLTESEFLTDGQKSKLKNMIGHLSNKASTDKTITSVKTETESTTTNTSKIKNTTKTKIPTSLIKTESIRTQRNRGHERKTRRIIARPSSAVK